MHAQLNLLFRDQRDNREVKVYALHVCGPCFILSYMVPRSPMGITLARVLQGVTLEAPEHCWNGLGESGIE